MKRVFKWLLLPPMCVGGALLLYEALTDLSEGDAHRVSHRLASVCELNKKIAIAAVEGSPLASTLHIKVISSGNPMTTGELCSVDVTLNSGTDETMYYHLLQVRGQPMIISGLGADGLELVKNYMAEHPVPSNPLASAKTADIMPLRESEEPPPPPPPRGPPPRPFASQPSSAPESDELLRSLEKLKEMQKQLKPPSGASLNGDTNAPITAQQRGAIGEAVRRCWTRDTGALDLEKMRVRVTVTTDASGMARIVQIADDDRSRVLGDPRLNAFFERAQRSILDPRCAYLPLPPDRLGSVQKLTFVFQT